MTHTSASFIAPTKMLQLAAKCDLFGESASAPNPFTTRKLRYELEIHKILRAFAKQLARPLERRDDESDYLPCRYLADRIRRAKLGGIRYGSAMQRSGSNVVLFDPANGEILLRGRACLTRATELRRSSESTPAAFIDVGAYGNLIFLERPNEVPKIP